MGTDSRVRAHESGEGPAGREGLAMTAHGSGRVGGIHDREGRALLAEAAALFRRYEAHHREQAAECDRYGPTEAGEDRARKAAVNAEIAGRIEAHLEVSDPEFQRLGEIWRDVPGTIEERPDDADPGLSLGWGEPVRPVDAIKAWAQSIGMDVDPDWEAQARAHCDELVPAEVEDQRLRRYGPAKGDAGLGSREQSFPLTRHPVAEGLEPSPHRADCECAVCWPVVHVTGGQFGKEGS